MEEEESHQQTLVIDNGSYEIKAGFCGEDAPRACFPTVMGWPRHAGVGGVMLGAKKDNLVGHEAKRKRGMLSLKFPVERGVITDWDDMEKIWHHTFYCELLVAPEEHPILMTDVPMAAKQSKENLSTMMFEVFNAPALYIANQAIISLYSTGRTTGIVVDSGEGQTHVVPVWEGYALPHYLTSLPLAGADLTHYLMSKLRDEGYPFSTSKDKDVVRDIKETVTYVSLNYENETKAAASSQSYERTYITPDGAQVMVSQNRFECPEVMFDPSMMGLEGQKGVHQLVYDCVQKCDVEVRKELYSNMVLAGGNTLFPRFEERLQKEVSQLVPKTIKGVKAVAFPERRYAGWLGGSLLASLETFACMWVSKLEYDEYGVNIIHRKF